MRIKHFAGYGSVNAKILMRSLNTATHEKQVVVQVQGNHEYGLDRSSYKDDVVRWLGKVIKDSDLNKADYWSIKVSYEPVYGIKDTNGCDLDTANYTITYNF